MLSISALVVAVAQISAQAQEFEVASMKPSPPDRIDSVEIGIHIDGAFVRCKSLSLRDYIRNAFQVKEYQISGPEWMKDVKFDLNAKLPEGATRANVPAMMQALLAERFKLTTHRDKKEFNIYALVVTKDASRLIESPAEATDAPAASGVDVDVQAGRGGATVNFGRGSYIRIADGKIEAKRVTPSRLVESIADYLDRPAIDMTGLTGIYDFTLDYSLDELRNLLRTRGVYANIPDSAAAGMPGSIRDSIKKFGLTLEARKAPLEIVVVDRLEKVPTAN
jgi:uncharacterized protein (TIGR03435 family)